jgi:altronate hydrolase
MHQALQIQQEDNVAVLLQNVQKGAQVSLSNNTTIHALEDAPAKQKILLNNIAKNTAIIMYGVNVGVLKISKQKGSILKKEDIQQSHNYFSSENYQQSINTLSTIKKQELFFNGYERSNGTVGTRNYWLIIPLVFCENNNVLQLKEALLEPLGYALKNPYKQKVYNYINNYNNTTAANEKYFKNVDGIKFLTHQMGCGGSREDALQLCKLIAAYINHANVGGATVLSLGCQNSTISLLKEWLQNINPNFDKPLFIVDQQATGTNEELLSKALDYTLQGLEQINTCQRTQQSISKLVLGLKCGGSDGFSGISANPSLGYASDVLVEHGGSSILAEFPELSGVEQHLINRSINKQVAQKFEHLFKDYAALSERFGNPFHNNPSEGNIKDGLLTDVMKSAGAARKGGAALVSAALDYGEPIATPGLQLLCTPGNDVEATTGIAASGATVTVFTTGLGTPTGNPITPTIKASSNTNLFLKMPDVIDFNCGTIIEGKEDIQKNGTALLQKIINIANGELTAAELLQQDDFIPWRKSISV